jgi:PPOX class probable F420-dependent enzyme
MPLVLTSEQIAFLNHQRVGHLATVSEDGQPHAVPICYTLLDGLLYTPIDEKPKRGDPASLRRLRNIAANPRVCLTVDHYEEDWSRLAWLQVRGVASLVEGAEERARAISALRGRYAQYREMDLESRPVVRITPRRVVGWGAALTPRPPLPMLGEGEVQQ